MLFVSAFSKAAPGLPQATATAAMKISLLMLLIGAIAAASHVKGRPKPAKKAA
jgi:hypothetical protein